MKKTIYKYMLLSLSLFCISCSSDNDDSGEVVSSAGASIQVSVIFMPNAVGDYGFNDRVQAGVSAFCDGGIVDELGQIDGNSKAVANFFRPTTEEEMVTMISSSWKKDSVNTVSGKGYEKRLLILTDPSQAEYLPSLSSKESVLMLDAEAVNGGMALQINAREEAREAARQVKIWNTGYPGETVPIMLRITEREYTDGIEDGFRDVFSEDDNLEYDYLDSRSTYGSLYVAARRMAELYGGTYKSFVSSCLVDLRQYASQFYFYYFTNTSEQMLVSVDRRFDDQPIQMGSTILRRYDKALVTWLNAWTSGQQMDATTVYTSDDGMCELITY